MDISSIADYAIIIRAIALYLPAVLGVALWIWCNPDLRHVAGILLATLWAFPALLVVQWVSSLFAWWTFDVEIGLLAGIPIDLLVGWVFLWATIPALLVSRFQIWFILVVLVGFDFLFMPLLSPVLQLDSAWVWGELFGILLVSVPAMLIACWTAEDRFLAGRVALQIATYSSLLFLFLPAIGVEWDVVNWGNLWALPIWQLSLVIQLIAIPGLIGLSAVQEFAVRGNGTPFPLDPPKLLVTSGIYAYIANPMQLSGSVMLLALGLVLQSFWLSMGALVTIVYSMGVADWSERDDLIKRYSDEWHSYREHVQKWRFRWRPWIDPTANVENSVPMTGILYTARDCDICTEVRTWFEGQRPSGLKLALAEEHPSRNLTRITYESPDGEYVVAGVAALGRGLEHIHLGWALLGMALRLPIVNQAVQLLVDATGGGPRLVSRDAITR